MSSRQKKWEILLSKDICTTRRRDLFLFRIFIFFLEISENFWRFSWKFYYICRFSKIYVFSTIFSTVWYFLFFWNFFYGILRSFLIIFRIFFSEFPDWFFCCEFSDFVLKFFGLFFVVFRFFCLKFSRFFRNFPIELFWFFFRVFFKFRLKVWILNVSPLHQARRRTGFYSNWYSGGNSGSKFRFSLSDLWKFNFSFTRGSGRHGWIWSRHYYFCGRYKVHWSNFCFMVLYITEKGAR